MVSYQEYQHSMIAAVNDNKLVGVEIFGAQMDQSGMKLSVESTIRKIDLPQLFTPPYSSFSTCKAVMMSHKLSEIVSLTSEVIDVTVFDQGKCPVYQYTLQDETGKVTLKSFTPLHVRVSSTYNFYDMTITFFRSDKHLKFDVVSSIQPTNPDSEDMEEMPDGTTMLKKARVVSYDPGTTLFKCEKCNFTVENEEIIICSNCNHISLERKKDTKPGNLTLKVDGKQSSYNVDSSILEGLFQTSVENFTPGLYKVLLTTTYNVTVKYSKICDIEVWTQPSPAPQEASAAYDS